jgi:hypothetical protein
MRVYLDTSVIGGCQDEEFSDWSVKLMREFAQGRKTAVLSDITLQEVELAPDFVKTALQQIPEAAREYVALDDEARKLANAYLRDGAVSEGSLLDAQHIAIATISRVEVLVSWNFKHMANLMRIRRYNSVNQKEGYGLIDIRSPREVLDEEDL